MGHIKYKTGAQDLEQLCKEYGWTVNHARAMNNYALRFGLANGHLETVAWVGLYDDLDQLPDVDEKKREVVTPHIYVDNETASDIVLNT